MRSVIGVDGLHALVRVAPIPRPVSVQEDLRGLLSSAGPVFRVSDAAAVPANGNIVVALLTLKSFNEELLTCLRHVSDAKPSFVWPTGQRRPLATEEELDRKSVV